MGRCRRCVQPPYFHPSLTHANASGHCVQQLYIDWLLTTYTIAGGGLDLFPYPILVLNNVYACIVKMYTILYLFVYNILRRRYSVFFLGIRQPNKMRRDKINVLSHLIFWALRERECVCPSVSVCAWLECPPCQDTYFLKLKAFYLGCTTVWLLFGFRFVSVLSTNNVKEHAGYHL